MARLRANRALEVLGRRELRLAQEESNALVARRGHELCPEALVGLYNRTRGWAAGLILMLEQAPLHDSPQAPLISPIRAWCPTTSRARSSRGPTPARASCCSPPPTCRR
ncbi:MAG TPA: hypothetical protein VNK67_04210 [Burkholderiales bacterium]|nr:hypothetical protein [Burkholderiales bacterium]